MRDLLRQSVRPAFKQAPRLRRAALRAIDRLVSPALYFFTLRHATPPSELSPDKLDADIARFNIAAEEYFAAHANDRHLLTKPFSEPESLSRRLIDLGVLIDGLRLTPGMTVLELGAGTCWVSHLFNKLGCRTIAVDVSSTALAMGRRVFEADPSTNWTLDPQFLPYDGLRLPVADGSVDAIVIYDAFHHLPNPQHLLREMHRVLAADGIVGMSEPGRGHAESQPSQAEASDTGVLEDELIIEQIATMATAAGFAATRRIIASNRPLLEIDAAKSGAFMGGHQFSTYWDRLCSALESHYLLLLYKGHIEPTTARPKHLKAHLSSASDALRLVAGMASRVDVRVQNVGDTRWLASASVAGWTRLGAHLYSGQPRRVVNYDWCRASLPKDIAPGGVVTIALDLPTDLSPGDYALVIDLVVEGVVWFADRESAALTMPLRVVSG